MISPHILCVSFAAAFLIGILAAGTYLAQLRAAHSLRRNTKILLDQNLELIRKLHQREIQLARLQMQALPPPGSVEAKRRVLSLITRLDTVAPLLVQGSRVQQAYALARLDAVHALQLLGPEYSASIYTTMQYD